MPHMHTSTSAESHMGGLDNFAWTQRRHTMAAAFTPFHLQAFPPVSHLHKRSAFILSVRPHLRSVKYLLFLGRACLFSGVCFQRWFGPVQRLNSAVSDTPVFGLAAAGDGGLAGSGGSECAGSVGCPPVAGQTGPVNLTTLRPFTLVAAHRIEYGLFGGRWQCQEC